MFMPATFELDRCDILLDRPTLRVPGMALDQVLLMKIHASRAVDTDDIELLWPAAGFESPEAAAVAYALAYPHEPEDPLLADHLRSIVE